MNSVYCAFPHAEYYPRSAHQWMAREKAAPNDHEAFCERHLHCVWYDPLYRPARLQSLDGEKIVVINPGRWNLEAGPDFLDAELLIGPEQRRIRGDVEIHIRAEDWGHHGHATDPRYDRVVAHITYWPGRLDKNALPAGTLQTSLRDALLRMPDFYFSAIDTSAYPYNTPSALRDALPTEWHTYSVDEKRALLRNAGESRLATKTEVLCDAIQAYGPDQALWETLCGALGYKQNRIPFRLLARALPFAELRERAQGDVHAAYALLLGVSGLMPDNLNPEWPGESQHFLRKLWDIWWRSRDALATRIMNVERWQRSHLRPQNHPMRRMAAAANFAANTTTPAERLSALIHTEIDTCITDLDNWLNVEDGMQIWNYHLSLGSQASKSFQALLGHPRRAAIMTNVVVPFLAAQEHDVSPWLSRLPPEGDSYPIKLCAVALFGPDHNPAEYRHGLMQQGLIQIFHDYVVNAGQ